MKRTHKLRAIGDAKDIVGFARNRAEAATQLGVNRSTLHRWIKAGKVPEPGSARPPKPTATESAPVVAPGQPPDEWAKAARAAREMSPTELQMVDLARAALMLAYSSGNENTQLSAMGRFSVLVKQLGLDSDIAGVSNASEQVGAKGAPRHSAASGVDPRGILKAAK